VNWSVIEKLRAGEHLRTWSVLGRAHSAFEILEVNDSAVMIQLQNGKIRRVPCSDFEKIYKQWKPYLSGRMSRHELLLITHHSTYIISILHHLGF
jgi:hypothetical protein